MSWLKSYFNKNTTILDRYLITQFSGPFFLAIGGFVIIGIVDILFYLVDLAIISGIPFFTVLRLLLYKIPAIMIMFFPMAVLFSIMLLLVRMAKDNELTVLRTSGVHTFRIIWPLLLLFLGTSFLSVFINEKIVPLANHASDKVIQKEIKKTPPLEIVENIVFKASGNRHFFIQKVDKKNNILENLLIFEQTRDFPRIISAKEAQIDHKTWTLMSGFIMDFDAEGVVSFVDRFDEMNIHLDEELNTYYRKQKSAKEMDSKTLKKRIDMLQKGGISTRALVVEYHMKKSLPAACFIFGLIGMAFCLSFVKSGKDWWGVIFAICISVLTVGFYFFIAALTQALAKDGTLAPFLGAWLPNFIYGSIACVLITYQCKYK